MPTVCKKSPSLGPQILFSSFFLLYMENLGSISSKSPISFPQRERDPFPRCSVPQGAVGAGLSEEISTATLGDTGGRDELLLLGS